MKVIREYSTEGDFLRCRVWIVEDDTLFNCDTPLVLKARVKPFFKKDSKHAVFLSAETGNMAEPLPGPYSLQFLTEEMSYFLTTLKQMYQL